MPSDFDRIATVEAFEKLGEGVGTMRQEEEDVTDEMQPEAGLLESGVKEVLFKEPHEQVSIGTGHLCSHNSSLDLEVMLGVKGEVVVGVDELVKEYSGGRGC